MATRAIRGATTVNEDTKEQILEAAEEMLSEIIDKNGIVLQDIVSILFTVTKDIKSAYPTAAARGLGITKAALLDFVQPDIKGSLGKCIRALMLVESDKPQGDMRHVYLKGAKGLRPDLIKDEKRVSVALDGPAGSGKSTIAKLVAAEMGFTYIDTGAMYRSVALYCIDKEIDYNSELDVLEALDSINISFISTNREQVFMLNGEDVTELIRSPEVSAGASVVAAYKGVREKLVAMQRELAKRQSVIMDGRDIGTNVLPNAEIKIFMVADPEERAKRRYDELKLKGVSVSYEDTLEDIKTRDYNDSNREYNPLKRADDAILLDTTYMTIDDVKNFIINKIKNYKKD